MCQYFLHAAIGRAHYDRRLAHTVLRLGPTRNHYQPSAEFGRVVTDVDRSFLRMNDKQVFYRANTLKTTSQNLNCTYTSKYPENKKDWIGKTAFPDWNPKPTKPLELNLSQGRFV